MLSKVASFIRFASILALGLALGLPATGAERKILVLGDSISAAYGIELEQGWVQLLAARLTNTGVDVKVINASVSGETTSGGVLRLPGALKRHEPELIVLELGGNDGLRGYPVDRIRANLLQMIAQAQAAKVSILLLGMRIPPNYGERYSTDFHHVFRAVAEEAGVPYVPFLLEGFATDTKLMQKDGIHPTEAAQILLLDNVWPFLSRLLRLA